MTNRAWTAFLALIATGLFAALIACPPAQAAEAKCGNAEHMLSTLPNDFGETIVWTGVTKPGVRFVLFQSSEGTWTLVALHGIMACIIGVGVDGEMTVKGLPV